MMKVGRIGKFPHLVVCFLPLSLALLLDIPALNAQPLPKKIVAGVSTLGGPSAILYLTQKVGFFERYGLDLQIVYFGSGAIAASGVLSGEAKITVMSGSSTLAAALGGADLVQLGGLTNKLAYGLMVSPSVKSLHDLKGSSIGIAGFGGASDFAANYIIRKEGMIPEKDIILIAVGGQPERFSALANGKLKAVLLEPPYTGRIERMGFRRLVNFPSLDLEFQNLGFVTTRSYLKAERAVCLNFLKAITEGIHFFKSHKKESMTLLASILKTQDQDALEETYSLDVHIIPDIPYSTLKGLHNILELLALRNPKAKNKDPREVVDDSLIKEMDDSGFIAYLRKTYPVVAQ
jgi:ABC-type nitrate/sulfonate/bicarbonate transport system substrate-binding protein